MVGWVLIVIAMFFRGLRSANYGRLAVLGFVILSAGVAGGAMLTTSDLAGHLRPGMHAATVGGNPLAARAGIAAIEMIEQQGLLANVERVANVFRTRLGELRASCEAVVDVRVLGMMIGVQLAFDGSAVVQRAMQKKLLINCTQGNVIRLLPAMTLTEAEAHEGCDLLCETIREAAS